VAEEKITQATKDAERQEAKAEHGAPQSPTPEEEAAAERAGGPSDETRESYEDMLDKGANQKGEGRLP
jgi:hypothetical protein